MASSPELLEDESNAIDWDDEESNELDDEGLDKELWLELDVELDELLELDELDKLVEIEELDVFPSLSDDSLELELDSLPRLSDEELLELELKELLEELDEDESIELDELDEYPLSRLP